MAAILCLWLEVANFLAAQKASEELARQLSRVLRQDVRRQPAGRAALPQERAVQPRQVVVASEQVLAEDVVETQRPGPAVETQEEGEHFKAVTELFRREALKRPEAFDDSEGDVGVLGEDGEVEEASSLVLREAFEADLEVRLFARASSRAFCQSSPGTRSQESRKGRRPSSWRRRARASTDGLSMLAWLRKTS